MSIGFKPKDSKGPHYHPERDFAYITPTLMKQAIENMSAPRNPEYEDWKKSNSITDAEIVLAAEALADAQTDFVNAADPVSSLQQALQRRKFFDLPLPVRLYMMAMIGEVMVGAWFTAVREVTQVGEESPAQNEMCRFSAAVREFAAAQGAPVINANSTAETVLAQNVVLRSTIRELRQLVADAKHMVEQLSAQLEIELARTPWQRFVDWIQGN
jgi:hypothetical protein